VRGAGLVNTPAHLSIGACVTLGACAALAVSPTFAAGAGLASLVGSRAPDWDIKLENWRRKLAKRRFIGRPFRGFYVPHRGWSHWLVSACLWTALCGLGAFLAWSAATLAVTLGVGAGYLAHLLADGCTIRGVPYWGPWNRRCVNLLGRRTSHWMSKGPWGGRIVQRMGRWAPKCLLRPGGDLVGTVAVLLAVGFAALLARPIWHAV
jgi:membrane-bound metal-dependent hydrolase YbcI (DUF457 family)